MFLYSIVSCVFFNALTLSSLHAMQEDTPVFSAYSLPAPARLYAILMNEKSRKRDINNFFKQHPHFDTASMHEGKSLIEHAVCTSRCAERVLNIFLTKGRPRLTQETAENIFRLYYNPPLSPEDRGTEDGWLSPKQRARMAISNAVGVLLRWGRLPLIDTFSCDLTKRKNRKFSVHILARMSVEWWEERDKAARKRAQSDRIQSIYTTGSHISAKKLEYSPLISTSVIKKNAHNTIRLKYKEAQLQNKESKTRDTAINFKSLSQ